MSREASDEKWSVVMTKFGGDIQRYREAEYDLFGRNGLCVMQLLGNKKKRYPFEIADNLTQQQAEEIVARLAALGPSAIAMATANLPEVRHRASEVWADIAVDGRCFSDIDGMVLTGSPVCAREQVANAVSKGPFKPWHYESFANHDHCATRGSDRDKVRYETGCLNRLSAALKLAYPDRRFVVSHIPAYSITFWQDPGEYPDISAPTMEPRDDKVFCFKCQLRQPFEADECSDLEFPQMEWGRCAVCGDELLVRCWEILRLVGDGPNVNI